MSYRLDTNDAYHDDPYYDERERARKALRRMERSAS